MKRWTVVADHCRTTPANMITAPMNKVARRPNISEEKGVNGRASDPELVRENTPVEGLTHCYSAYILG